MIDRHNHTLCVERLQGLRCAAATSHNENVTAVTLCRRNSTADRIRRRITLHLCRIDQQMSDGIAPPDDVFHVLKRRTGVRSNDADLLGHCRERTFCRRIEHTHCRQFFLELFQRQRLCASAVRLEICHIQLKCAVPFIERCRRCCDHIHPFPGREPQMLGIAPEHHRLDTAFRIPERKIEMPRPVVVGEIGDLATHQDALQRTILFQLESHIAVQLTHA